MKISYNWLKQYLNFDLSPEDLSELLTDIGLEVEDLSEYKGPGQGLEGLVIGEVKDLQSHPDADKLRVATVNVGGKDDLQIVCGAPNVAAGQKVVVAPVGSVLYPEKGDKFPIKKAKIRGVESFGMICAEDEIGLGDDHSGIIVLPESATVGQLAKDYYEIQPDYVFEIGLTPNRSDATGHIGVARDVKAALEVRNGQSPDLTFPDFSAIVFDSKEEPVKVEVEDNDACKRYSGIVIENITVGESPMWLQERLRAVGQRPLNNIVDVTNFVLQEYGQPLHAFDAEKIDGNKVVVKTMAEGSSFVTLDEVERKLSGEDLMICNKSEGMCIAGVFGGAKSGVTESTKTIFLESACFDAVSIRKTATRHNLRTDAAIRFEKGADPNITIDALKRATDLIVQLAGGKVASKIIDEYPSPVPDHKVDIAFAQVNRLIGHSIEPEIVKLILRKLDIKIENETNEGLSLSVPPYRVDVTREVDVIEEILRIYGFNNIPIPEKLNASLSYQENTDKIETVNNVIANYLTANSFHEILANSITHSEYYVNQDDLVKLKQSANAGLDVLRANTLYSGLENIAYNLNRRNQILKFFEFGKSYLPNKDTFEERNHLSLWLTGDKQSESWIGQSKKVDFYYMKSFVQNVLQRLNVEFDREMPTSDDQFSYGIVYSNGQELVRLGTVNSSILERFDIKQEVFFTDFNWDNVLKASRKKTTMFAPVPKFPGIRRDLSLLLNQEIQFADVHKIAEQEGKRNLKSVNLFDVYEDKKLGDQRKSYAVSLFFEDEKKTMSDKEIDKIMNKIINRCKDELNAEMR